MKSIPLLILILFSVMLIAVPTVSAVSYVEEQRGATMHTFALVSLGIENIPGMSLVKAVGYYNWISMAFLFLIGAMSSKRMTRFFAILIPVFAALFVYIGWLQSPNPVQTWSVIVMCGIMGAVTYMKGSLKENYGSGGPGSLILNIVFYLIILQTCVGIINASGVWVHNNQTNSIATPTNYQQNSPNADLTSQVPTMTTTGGFYSDLTGAGSAVLGLVTGCILMLLNIIVSIAFFSVTINTIFPFIAETPLGLFMLAALQIGIWFIYALFLRDLSTSKQTTTDF